MYAEHEATMPARFSTDEDINLAEIEEMEKHLPADRVISLLPPHERHMIDPMWYEVAGRDPIDKRKILQLTSHDEIKKALAAVLEEWPKYGPAIYEKAAKHGRLDFVEILLELGAPCNPETMKKQNENETEDDIPLLEPEHGFIEAIKKGHLDIVKVFVEHGDVDINYAEDENGCQSLGFAVGMDGTRNVEMVRWLLEHGATMSTVEEKGGRPSDLTSAILGGNIEITKLVLENEQAVSAGLTIIPDHIRFAASSNNVDMVRLVLDRGFGLKDPDSGFIESKMPNFTEEHKEMISSSLGRAIEINDLDSVRCLLKLLIPFEDGSFKVVRLPDSMRTEIFNATEDALEERDIPELFEFLWETVLQYPPESDQSIEEKRTLSIADLLNRRLISACSAGRSETVKLLVGKYGADVNHVSHKYFTTPLSRAAGSNLFPLPGRLEVVEYLCNRPELDIHIGCGEYANGETALALAIRYPQEEMIRLLLSYGGPIEEVPIELRDVVDNSTSDEEIKVYVQLKEGAPRKPVRLLKEHDDSDGVEEVMLKYNPKDLRNLIRNLIIRKEDKDLKIDDLRRKSRAVNT